MPKKSDPSCKKTTKPKKAKKKDPVFETLGLETPDFKECYTDGPHGEKKQNLFLLLLAIPAIALVIFLVMSSCTLSITTVHTQGKASNVVDEEQTTDPDIKPNIDIPLSFSPLPLAGAANGNGK